MKNLQWSFPHLHLIFQMLEILTMTSVKNIKNNFEL